MTAPIRFLQIGDLHLGRHEWNADRVRALDQIIAEGLRQPLAAWLIPGDLDETLMTVADKNVLADRFTIMANHAPAVVATGNHDVPGDLDFLAKLGATHRIYVITQPSVIRVPLPDVVHTAAIFVMPYPSRLGLVAAGTPPAQVPTVARQALEHIFRHAAQQLQAATAEGCIPLMIGHLNVGGSLTSTGQPNIGKEIELDPTLLDMLGPIYKGLNHIHKAQEIAGAYYAGSCCRLNWGEIEEKRYLTIDYVADANHVWTFTVHSHPIDVPPMYHVEGELTREGFFITEVMNATGIPGEIDWTGAKVRVRYTYAQADCDLLDFDLVKAPFVGAQLVVPDPIPTHTRAVRAPEVAEAQTAEAKMIAYVRSAGVNWTPSLEQKFAMLQQPDAAAFLTQLEVDVTGLQPFEDDDPPGPQTLLEAVS
jgi:calcineurin-like phosphoesterase family protein